MEPEEGKQIPHKNPYTQHEEVSSDFGLAIRLHEQDGTFPSLESDNESDSSSSFDNYYYREADFFLSQEIESELQFLESEESNDDYDDDDDVEADDIDVDEMTYEELIELGDFMGKEKTGLSAIEISSCLHSAEIKSGIDKCVICQVEYEDGEALVALQCEHPYHTDCISKWLQIKKVCPICSIEISVPNMVNKNP
ncbi:PREDICTED: E3 ubiquitin ligase BIG BROTHER-related-like [Lupinus angustifolius]|uniref:E3 ubiquitin ligase BIG BROTHER-related-like n=1 Tax=Lupinus angustifolius TaxID=3871 RepID=UPI00092F218E|nr:PREDICTED: E3 ubiquitin ligase BIG BROTHER-related-like [Lupinus angustifolius]